MFDPRCAKSIAPTFCISEHMRTQRAQDAPEGSRMMESAESSILSCFSYSRSALSIPKRSANSCRRHFPF